MPVLDIAARPAGRRKWHREAPAFCWHSPHLWEGGGRRTHRCCCPHEAPCNRRSHHHHPPPGAPALPRGFGDILGHAAAPEMEPQVLKWLLSPGLRWWLWCQPTGRYPELSKVACRCGPPFLTLVLLSLEKASWLHRKCFQIQCHCPHILFSAITYILAVSLML